MSTSDLVREQRGCDQPGEECLAVGSEDRQLLWRDLHDEFARNVRDHSAPPGTD
jgi:hypothetical protein